MYKLIKQYVLLAVLMLVTARLISGILVEFAPHLFITELEEGVTRTTSGMYLEAGLKYMFNIILALIMLNDMKKLQIRSPLIIIATIFNSYVGVVLFLIVAAGTYLISKNESDERIYEAI